MTVGMILDCGHLFTDRLHCFRRLTLIVSFDHGQLLADRLHCFRRLTLIVSFDHGQLLAHRLLFFLCVCVCMTVSFIHYKYNTTIKHMSVHLFSTPVSTVYNRHTNIHLQFMHTCYTKRCRHTASHTDI